MLLPLLRRSRRQRAGGTSPIPSLVGLGLAVLAVVCLPLAGLSARIEPDRPGPTSSLPWLSTRQGEIVDSTGRVVLLRGFNDDALLQTGGAPPPPALTGADAALIEAEGFDVVRLPISWSRLEPTRGQFSAGYLKQIVAVVNLCAQHHLYVVLDMHTEDFGVGFGGSGAPRWLSVPGVPDLTIPILSSAWQRHLSPAVNAALTFFWLYPNWQKLYWQAWTKVAAQFRGDSAVAGYDLYNEPHPFPVPPAIFETHLLWPFYATGIRDLAKVDPNHLFIVEGDLFGGLPTAVRPLAARDLVYSTHLYSGSILPPSFTGNRRPLEAELAQALGEARQLPAAYWAGELGIDHNRSDAVPWAQAELALANRSLTGWAWWQWNDPSGWGVRQGSGPPDTTWLQVLAQPFVRSWPGALSRLQYQPSTRTLSAQLNGPSVGGNLLISWPASAGLPHLEGSCLAASGPYRPASGELALRILSSPCRLVIRG